MYRIFCCCCSVFHGICSRVPRLSLILKKAPQYIKFGNRWSKPLKNYEKFIIFMFSVKQINRQLIAVLQFVISTAAGFLFGFLGIELMLSTTFDLGFKLLLGIICALIIALAEIYFLAKKLAEDYEPLDTSGKVHQD